MPYKAARPCATPGCPNLTTNTPRYCDVHLKQKQQRTRTYDDNRGTASQRGYDARWQKARRIYLSEHPLCVLCQQEGRVTAASVVDHIIPHRGDYSLMWDENNWQSLCTHHHAIKTASQDGAFGNKETR